MRDQNLASGVELIKKRLALLRELAGSLTQAQSAVVQSNLSEIHRQTARQREICAALRQIETESQQQRPPWSAGASLEAQKHWTDLVQRLRETETEVQRMSRVYGALLRRARRTVEIFCRLLASCALTYAPPGSPAAVVYEASRHV